MVRGASLNQQWMSGSHDGVLARLRYSRDGHDCNGGHGGAMVARVDTITPMVEGLSERAVS